MDKTACWHKVCRIKYSAWEFERIQKRKRYNDSNGNEAGCSTVGFQSRPTRSDCKSMKIGSVDKLCFFCEAIISSSDKYRRIAATFDLDRKVRLCATELSGPVS